MGSPSAPYVEHSASSVRPTVSYPTWPKRAGPSSRRSNPGFDHLPRPPGKPLPVPLRPSRAEAEFRGVGGFSPTAATEGQNSGPADPGPVFSEVCVVPDWMSNAPSALELRLLGTVRPFPHDCFRVGQRRSGSSRLWEPGCSDAGSVEVAGAPPSLDRAARET